MKDKKTTVLIVDDSPSARELLTYIINKSPNLEVVGCAENGEKALEFLEYFRPDVITMDIVMPKMDGFETTRRIMAKHPIPILVITSSFNPEDVSKSFKAMDAGCLAILQKPAGPQDPAFPMTAKSIVDTINNISDVKLITRRHQLRAPVSTPLPPPSAAQIEAIAIGASLGGPQALQIILSQLPAHFPIPIFIVQHISDGFVQGFVEWINETTPLNVKLGKHDDIAKPGDVIVAPDRQHLKVGHNNRVVLSREKSPETLCPSVGELFSSVGAVYGPRGIGIILTGMGRDGVEELLEMRKSGATTIAQDEAGCTMFGMPREAIEKKAAKHVIPLNHIAPMLMQLAAIRV